MIKITAGAMLEFFDHQGHRQTYLVKRSGPKLTVIENISQPYKCADVALHTEGVIALVEKGRYTLLPPAPDTRNLVRCVQVNERLTQVIAPDVEGLEDLTPYQDPLGRSWILLADLENILTPEVYRDLRRTLRTTELDLNLLTPLSPWEK